ncbi:hypothetical protein DB31_1860 [Hyalangium minutum]|uniref:Uncharacterized protein n=1 Tax=Hyalangium minutum TaxID=394096 RepID=A0A085WAX9_9BACT|nr:hypothetical protein DB31_1860 [Hyalangium minutum]
MPREPGRAGLHQSGPPPIGYRRGLTRCFEGRQPRADQCGFLNSAVGRGDSIRFRTGR